MPDPALEPHDPLADDPKSNPGLSRGKALWIIAILFALMFGAYFLYGQYDAGQICDKVHQIYDSAGEGRNLDVARREATARGLDLAAVEQKQSGSTRVTLWRSGRIVGSWSTGPDRPGLGPHCVRGRHF